MATKKENKKVEKAVQEEEIRKTQEIIINETIINQTIKDSEQKEKLKKDSKKSLFFRKYPFNQCDSANEVSKNIKFLLHIYALYDILYA